MLDLLKFCALGYLNDQSRRRYEYRFWDWICMQRNWSLESDRIRPRFTRLAEKGLAEPKPQPKSNPAGPQLKPYQITENGKACLYYESATLLGVIAELRKQGYLLSTALARGHGLLEYRTYKDGKEQRVARPMWHLYFLSYVLLKEKGYPAGFQKWLNARGRVTISSIFGGIMTMEKQAFVAACEVECEEVRASTNNVPRRYFRITNSGCAALMEELAALSRMLNKLDIAGQIDTWIPTAIDPIPRRLCRSLAPSDVLRSADKSEE